MQESFNTRDINIYSIRKLCYYILQSVVPQATGKLFNGERHGGPQYSLDNYLKFL